MYRPTGACMEQREEQEQQVLERATYSTCPITGSVKVTCCKIHIHERY